MNTPSLSFLAIASRETEARSAPQDRVRAARRHPAPERNSAQLRPRRPGQDSPSRDHHSTEKAAADRPFPSPHRALPDSSEPQAPDVRGTGESARARSEALEDVRADRAHDRPQLPSRPLVPLLGRIYS